MGCIANYCIKKQEQEFKKDANELIKSLRDLNRDLINEIQKRYDEIDEEIKQDKYFFAWLDENKIDEPTIDDIKTFLRDTYPNHPHYAEEEAVVNRLYMEAQQKNKTYVHESTFSTTVHPWFKEPIKDISVSLPGDIFDPHILAGGYENAFMAPVVMVVGIFVGKYLYRKFVKKQNTQQKQKIMP